MGALVVFPMKNDCTIEEKLFYLTFFIFKGITATFLNCLMCRVLVMLVISARKEPPFQIQQTTSLGEYAQEGIIVRLEHMIHKNVLKEVSLIPLEIKISAAASRAHLASFVVQEDLNCHQGNVILDIFALVDRKQAHQLNIRVHLVIIVLWVVHIRCLAVMEPIRMNLSKEHARSAFRATIAMEQFSMLLTAVMECNSLLHVSRVTSVQVELDLLGNTSAQPVSIFCSVVWTETKQCVKTKSLWNF